MSRDVTKPPKGGRFVRPTPTPELRKLIDRREVIAGYGGDDGMSGGGEFRRGRWIPPDWVDIRERDRAALDLHELRKGLLPESEAVIVDFLNMIWVATKHGADQTFAAVAMVYPRMLQDFPQVCWSPEMLRKAGQRFKTFFPAVGELVEFLEPAKRELEEEIAIHEAIVGTTTKKPSERAASGQRPWAEGGAEDHAQFLRDKQDRERRELVEIMRQRDLAEGRVPLDTSVPDRAPLEGDKDYVARVMQTIRSRIDDGARARRGDEERNKARREAQVGEKTREAHAQYRAAKEQGPPPPPPQGSHPPDGERLAGMTPDFTTPEDS
jgi:hypothetical protein